MFVTCTYRSPSTDPVLTLNVDKGEVVLTNYANDESHSVFEGNQLLLYIILIIVDRHKIH